VLLAVDIGNTNIKLGAFSGGELRSTFRITTKLNTGADEYTLYVKECLSKAGFSFSDVSDVIISSVIPMLNYTFEHLCTYCFGKKPLFVSHKLNTGLKIRYEKPQELGTDRIVTAAAALKFYGKADAENGKNALKPAGKAGKDTAGERENVPLIVTDFGTALTFNVVGRDASFLGGLIFPGVKTSLESLVAQAAKLPGAEITKPEKVVGDTTERNLQAGMYFGFTGLVEYIVKKIKDETGFSDARVIATGGFAQMFSEATDIFYAVDKRLSLLGLELIYGLNSAARR
jgi:type III pantothenate kinase